MFLHGGWMHLIGNMWFLWLFGDNVEEALGRFRYLIFYFVAGTHRGAGAVLQHADSKAPMIGASGAIAGVLGGYVMLYPRARVVTFVAIPFLWNFVDIPAWIFLGIWFLSQFLHRRRLGRGLDGARRRLPGGDRPDPAARRTAQAPPGRGRVSAARPLAVRRVVCGGSGTRTPDPARMKRLL